MELNNIFADDDAVSPVIGVILMVAITVILAAVIGTFVLGLGDQVSNTSPSASFTFDFSENNPSGSVNANDELTITHDGGDKINPSQLSIAVSGAVDDSDAGTPSDRFMHPTNATWGNVADENVEAGPAGDPADDDEDVGSVSAGSTVTLRTGMFSTTSGSFTQASNVDLSGATVRITWQSSNGGDTATLGKWTGPDA